MTDYAILEIGLHRHDATRYRIEPRLWLPDEDADRRPPGSVSLLVELDLDELGALDGQPTEYGEKLRDCLFIPPVRDLLTKGREVLTGDPPVPLRLRLYIGPSAPELHGILWETLRDPHIPGALLTTNDNIPFSRYLSSWDWHAVRLRPKGALKALVVVADPESEEGTKLAKVDVEGELKRAKAALGDIPMDVLCRCEDDACAELDLNVVGRPTLNAIIGHLREGIRLHEGYDILYLACHGKLVKGVPMLWLEDDQGRISLVSAEEEELTSEERRPGLVLLINQLDQLPRLIVLASCESAGTGSAWDEGALAALGPRLAEAGVPAVLAMQGSVSMQTVAEFMPVFFEELIERDGQIDRALAYARATVLNNDRPDWWMPVLFTRLYSGRLWYEPQFAPADFDIWPALDMAIRKRKCTPVVGPGLIDFLLGTPQEIAAEWAESLHFPMAPHTRTDLPRVARFLDTMYTKEFLLDHLEEHLVQQVRQRHPNQLAGEPENSSLGHLIQVVGEKRREAETEAFRVLAQLPLSIFITANPDGLLFDALKEADKDPQTALCPWNDYIEQPDSAYAHDPNYVPSRDKPLVYHLFGHLEQPISLVLSEDDYFEYLIWASHEMMRGAKSEIPSDVSAALNKNALMFLGFQLDDWSFRVILHSIVSPEASKNPLRYRSVAVQIGPEEGRVLQPRLARKYLERYFEDFRNVKSSVYWGTASDFARALWERRENWKVD